MGRLGPGRALITGRASMIVGSARGTVRHTVPGAQPLIIVRSMTCVPGLPELWARGAAIMGRVEIRERCPVDDVALTMLHAAAFGETPRLRPWSEQLARHSLTWLGAFDGARMIGFANVAWDGGLHAFLLDVLVDPARQREGIGRSLVASAVRVATDAGCAWLHADFADDRAGFFERSGLTPTAAGLIRLHTPGRRGA